jgi:transposase
MAGETINMIKLKQIFLLRSQGVSYNGISNIIGSSRNTVKKYIRLAEGKGLDFDQLKTKSAEELELLFAEPAHTTKDRQKELESYFPDYKQELKRIGVTRWILWGEYKTKHPDGYSYAQFCDLFRSWSKSKEVSAHFKHTPGDKVLIDYTGKRLEYVDAETGEIVKLEVLVCVLAYSQYTYVEAMLSQKKHDFIKGVENALHYFEGSPRALVPDNLKAAVQKADKYEPVINPDFLEFANHYQTAVVPARSRKPKDKASAETHVKIIYSRVFALLRDQVFHSLEAVNEAILPLLEDHNKALFKREKISRRERFYQDELLALTPLPSERYKKKEYKKVKVMKISHVQLDNIYYSVPHRYIGRTVKVIYTRSQVSVFCEKVCIAVHPRSFTKYSYVTIADHMPSNHRFVSEWNPEKFINWADRIDSKVRVYIEKVIEKKPHPEQAYKSCIGILSFEKKVGKERLISAVERGLHFDNYGYSVIKGILNGNLDELFKDELNQELAPLPDHENIRGESNFNY